LAVWFFRKAPQSWARTKSYVDACDEEMVAAENEEVIGQNEVKEKLMKKWKYDVGEDELHQLVIITGLLALLSELVKDFVKLLQYFWLGISHVSSEGNELMC
jgi:hypothetical protein